MSRPDAARLTRTAYAAHRKARGLPGGTLRSVQHAIADGRITIGPDGKLDPAEADRKWRNNTMPDRGGTRPGAGRPRRKKAKAEAVDGREATTMPELRRQREAVRLRRERLELRRLEQDTFDRAALKACTFKLWRSVRDRFDAAVGRESPLLAARLGVEEGRMYRELRAFVRGVEQEISDRGAVKLLAEAGKTGDEDEEVRP